MMLGHHHFDGDDVSNHVQLVTSLVLLAIIFAIALLMPRSESPAQEKTPEVKPPEPVRPSSEPVNASTLPRARARYRRS